MKEKQETCQHVWIYDHADFDNVFLRCPRCGMIRVAYPGETCHVVSRELHIRHDGRDGDV